MPTPEPEEIVSVAVASPNVWQALSKAMCGLVEAMCGPQRMEEAAALDSPAGPSTSVALKTDDTFEFSSLMQCFPALGNDSETLVSKGQASWLELAGVACVTPIIEAQKAMLAEPLPEPKADAAAKQQQQQQQARIEAARPADAKAELEIAESAPATPAEKAAELHRQGLRHNKQGQARLRARTDFYSAHPQSRDPTLTLLVALAARRNTRKSYESFRAASGHCPENASHLISAANMMLKMAFASAAASQESGEALKKAPFMQAWELYSKALQLNLTDAQSAMCNDKLCEIKEAVEPAAPA